MTFIESILLGITQGATEFLPVSSSGHLMVARSFMGLGDIPILFDILMHFPTLIAILLVFRRRVAGIILSILHAASGKKRENDGENLRLLAAIVVATLFTGLIGLAVDRIERTLTIPVKGVGALFIVTAVILIISRFFAGKKTYGDLGFREGLITGVAQGIGVLPGISRSGITISASLGAGISREKAGEFSFLISVPAILGALALKVKDVELLPVDPLVLAAGLIACFLVGLLSLLLLMRLIRKGRLYLFSLYLVPLGVIVLLWG
ncbi:MAG TPA: undecaprenyl-diphosphate phosphatase [Spirochaetia bacterium]|nr:undecaprenyl-diphosphate phosphatase [Spirochaetia bacterium]